MKKGYAHSKADLAQRIDVARGEKPANLVIKNVNFLDVFSGEFLRGDVAVQGDTIAGTGDSYSGEIEINGEGRFLVPGFIDAHVHIESSLMTPVSFQQAVLPCGTTTVIWDPHEITNVHGVRGIKWALDSSEGLLLDVFVMLPSCVPSTPSSLGLETSGAELTHKDLKPFLKHPRVLGLAEMMNFPGVLMKDPEVLNKLLLLQDRKRDGHAPGVAGHSLNAYSSVGIHSDHESTTLAEAKEKLAKGIHALIREGSCAKDANALLPILSPYTSDSVAFCSDDRNPADIAKEGHINHIVNMGLKKRLRPEDVFRAASLGAARVFGLEDRGAIAPGFLADFCLLSPTAGSWTNGASIEAVYKRGTLVIQDGLPPRKKSSPSTAKLKTPKSKIRNIKLERCTPKMFRIEATPGATRVLIIGVRPGQIITDRLVEELPVQEGRLQPDPSRDIQKIAVLERHRKTGRFAIGFVKGFGLKNAAIATSINHDAHNVIVVGSDDEVMAEAVNQLRKIDGGIVVVDKSKNIWTLKLPLGGLMTDAPPESVATAINLLKKAARELGCRLEEPFLQLSFLALPVIPTLKLTDRGLVDVTQFRLVSLFES